MVLILVYTPSCKPLSFLYGGHFTKEYRHNRTYITKEQSFRVDGGQSTSLAYDVAHIAGNTSFVKQVPG